jgi:hypothetical protein
MNRRIVGGYPAFAKATARARARKITCQQRIVGGYSEEVPPLTIPNREVKLPSADGTAPGGRVGRRQHNKMGYPYRG